MCGVGQGVLSGPHLTYIYAAAEEARPPEPKRYYMLCSNKVVVVVVQQCVSFHESRLI